MGVSTNAVLFYGYCWDEPCDLFNGALSCGDDDEIEWTEAILRRRGLVNPWDAMPPDLNRYLPGEGYAQKDARTRAWTDAHREELDGWALARQQVETEFGVSVGRHCSSDHSIPYLTIDADDAKTTVYRGYPKQLAAHMLTALPEWAERLKRFAQEFNIKLPQPEPGWWLVSYWG